jgi:hypothetical protein
MSIVIGLKCINYEVPADLLENEVCDNNVRYYFYIIISGLTALHGPCGLPQKLLPAAVSGYCFFRFNYNSLFKGGVVSPTPNPRLS